MMFPTLAEQKANKCVHFNGMQNKQCKVGVCYDSVQDKNRKGFASWPCWREGADLPCDKRHFPTPEEVAKEIEEHNKHWEQLKLAMNAAHEDAKKRGFKKGKGGSAKIKCPCCTGGELRYSVASYNGHVHGKCSTPKCMSWMQ